MASLASSERRSKAQASSEMLQDLELRILTERLRLLSTQRELAALRCQRFTRMLEGHLTAHAAATGSASAAVQRQQQAPEWDSSDDEDDDAFFSVAGRSTARRSLDNSSVPSAASSNNIHGSLFEAEMYYSAPSRSSSPRGSLKERPYGRRQSCPRHL